MYVWDAEEVRFLVPSFHSSCGAPAAMLQFLEVTVWFIYVVDSVYVAAFGEFVMSFVV